MMSSTNCKLSKAGALTCIKEKKEIKNVFLTAIFTRLLLHTELANGSVMPVWEKVDPEDVMVLKDVMAAKNASGCGVEIVYNRVPITAERAPDFADLADLIEVVVRNQSSQRPIVLNCQLGRGRSTMTSVRDLTF
jgi:protein-tyrosine phosphatase